jgi:hypothetical protein
MEELLKQFVGKKIDVSCGGSAVYRGRVQDVRDGVLFLVDEDERAIYLSIGKIASVCECKDNAGRPGFVG